MRDALGTVGGHLRVQRRRGIRLAALPRDFGVLVFVLGVARRAARLLDVGTYHGHNGVIRHTSFAGTIIIQNVTKSKLALLHLLSRRDYRWRGLKVKGGGNLTRAVLELAIARSGVTRSIERTHHPAPPAPPMHPAPSTQHPAAG